MLLCSVRFWQKFLKPLLIENGSHYPPQGFPLASLAPISSAELCATAQTGWLASERVARAAVNENDSQNICLRQFNVCLLHVDMRCDPCNTMFIVKQRSNMRLIEQQMCNAVINKNDWRKDNTEVMYSPSRDVCCVYLHKNLIATIDNNSVEIYDGGWQSNTTKSRLNAIINTLCDGTRCGVFQKQFEWFITDNNETVEFEHGYTFSRN